MTRYYFHLVNGHEVMLDVEGIEAASLAEVQAETMKALNEFQCQFLVSKADWQNWRIDVVDSAEATIFSVDLGDLDGGEGRRGIASLN